MSTSIAHDWYPHACCGGQDCKPIPCDELVETKDGYRYKQYTFKSEQTQPSLDNKCHVCLYKYQDGTERPMCAFVQMSF